MGKHILLLGNETFTVSSSLASKVCLTLSYDYLLWLSSLSSLLKILSDFSLFPMLSSFNSLKVATIETEKGDFNSLYSIILTTFRRWKVGRARAKASGKTYSSLRHWTIHRVFKFGKRSVFSFIWWSLSLSSSMKMLFSFS